MPIHGALMAEFPTNKELSEARAANAAKALAAGGHTNATTTRYGDTNPVEPNTTAAGRAKDRRVEFASRSRRRDVSEVGRGSPSRGRAHNRGGLMRGIRHRFWQ